METATAGLLQAQHDMLASLAEEVDRLRGERALFEDSAKAGWARAHALSDELRRAKSELAARDQALAEAIAEAARLQSAYDDSVIEYRKADRHASSLGTLLLDAQKEVERLRALAEWRGDLLAALKRGSEAPAPTPHGLSADDRTAIVRDLVSEVATGIYAELEKLFNPAPDGPTADMLAGRRHEVLGPDAREMTQGWRA